MAPVDARAWSLDAFLSAVSAWAAAEPGIAAIALVGSHARGAARPGSDVDLVVLSDASERFLEDTSWVSRFGSAKRRTLERWGRVTSVRVWYEAGGEVEFGFATPDWAATPLDEGTRRVAESGLRALFDREGILNGLARP